MLQWMGGSRRKVATSRKSTQRRQKQYFEQRKRLQQQQPASQEENLFDEENRSCEQNKNNRSLDVLSLLNLSTISQERKSCCNSARNGLEGEVLPVNYQPTQPSPAIRTNEAISAAVRPIEARTSLRHEAAAIYPKKVSINALGNEDIIQMVNHDRVNNLTMDTEPRLSMIDLVGDGPSSNSGEGAVREAHVAFSIEGLGKVTTETPVHSPEACGRTYKRELASPSNRKKQAQVIKNYSDGLNTIEAELDSIWNIDLPHYASSMEKPLCSKSPEKSSINKFKNSSRRKFQPLDSNCNDYSEFFGDDELCYREKGDYWNGSHSVLPNVLDEEEYTLECGTQLGQMNGCSVDYFNIPAHKDREFFFEGSYLDDSRMDFNALKSGTPDLYFQSYTPKTPHDFNITDETWTHMGGRFSGVGQVERRPAWSYFPRDEAGQSLSEESCSAAAVSGTTDTPPLMSLENDSFSINHMSLQNKYSWKTTRTNEKYYSDSKTRHAGRKYGSRMFNGESNSPKSTHKTCISSENFGVLKNRSMSKAGHVDCEIPSFSPLYHSPGTECISPNGNLWTKDNWCASSLNLQSDIDSRPTFRKSSASTCSPCSKFESEEFDFSQLYGDVNSFNSILPGTSSAQSMPNMCQNSRKGQRDWNLLNGLDFEGSAERSSGRHGGKTTTSLPINNGKNDLQDVSGSNGLSLETETNASEIEGRPSSCEAPLSRMPEKQSSKVGQIELDAEDTSSAVELIELTNKSGDTQDLPGKKVAKNDTQIPEPRQDESEDIDTEKQKFIRQLLIHMKSRK